MIESLTIILNEVKEYIEKEIELISTGKSTLSSAINRSGKVLEKQNNINANDIIEIDTEVKKIVQERDIIKFKSTCLYYSLFWYVLATRLQIKATIYIGWPKLKRKHVIAHAWTQVGELSFCDDESSYIVIFKQSNMY